MEKCGGREKGLAWIYWFPELGSVVTSRKPWARPGLLAKCTFQQHDQRISCPEKKKHPTIQKEHHIVTSLGDRL